MINKLNDNQRDWILNAISASLLENGCPPWRVETFARAASSTVCKVIESFTEPLSYSAAIIATGDKETDAGIEKAYTHANPEWVQMALDVVYRACVRLPEWSVNDIRDEINASEIKTHSNYAMGGIIGAAKKNGWITQARSVVGEPKKVLNTAGHLTTIQVWKSLIYVPEF